MAKKILFTATALFALLLCQMAAECFAGVWDQVEELDEFKQATAFKRSRNYQQAEKTYQDIIQQYPGTFWALEAQKKLTQLYILQGKDSGAEQTLNKMIEDFSSHPDLPKSLHMIAKEYRKVRKYDKADDLRQQIIQRFPDSVWTLWVQKEDAVVSHIAAGEDEAAEAIVNKMTVDFSDDTEMPGVLWLIARGYKKAGKDDKAENIYQQLVKRYPGTIWVLRVQKERARVHLKSGNEEAVRTIVNELLADFSEHPGLAEVLCKIARECEKAKRYDTAKGIYQQVIQRFPDSFQAGKAPFDMLKLQILLFIDVGNDIAAQQALDQLIADFNGHPGLVDAVFSVDNEYYKRANLSKVAGQPEQAEDLYRKSISVCEKVIEELPANADHIPSAYWRAAICYSHELGEYQQGIEYYQQIVDNWPDYRYAGDAQYLIGKYDEKLRDSGKLPESEADAEIEAAYKAVLEKYPECESAEYACLKLGISNFKKEQWVEAAMYFELFLQKSYESPPPSWVLYDLGRAYEETGELDLAAQAYNVFIAAYPDDPRTENVLAKLEKLEGDNR